MDRIQSNGSDSIKWIGFNQMDRIQSNGSEWIELASLKPRWNAPALVRRSRFRCSPPRRRAAVAHGRVFAPLWRDRSESPTGPQAQARGARRGPRRPRGLEPVRTGTDAHSECTASGGGAVTNALLASGAPSSIDASSERPVLWRQSACLEVRQAGGVTLFAPRPRRVSMRVRRGNDASSQQRGPVRAGAAPGEFFKMPFCSKCDRPGAHFWHRLRRTPVTAATR
ncbi:hypothetical protein M885DRAFT_183566 [Pelagophyceae sp. CCMP2097]|nr:hypothetical protein M885DRAFT_183566 [Pelagophyceae sp. CCMP2097]